MKAVAPMGESSSSCLVSNCGAVTEVVVAVGVVAVGVVAVGVVAVGVVAVGVVAVGVVAVVPSTIGAVVPVAV